MAARKGAAAEIKKLSGSELANGPGPGGQVPGTQAGRTLYGLRKQAVEPVFGIIKRVMGWRQMSLRGLNKAQGEWSLVTMPWNIKRMHVLRAAA